MKYGYLRVSTEDQDTARQEDGLRELCNELHIERLSAVAANRPVFDSVISSLKEGDTLIVWDLDRAFRSTVDMLLTLEKLEQWGVHFQIVTLGIDTRTEAGELVATMMAAVARFERRLIARRTKEGMAAQKRRGVHVGRPKALSEAQIIKARDDIAAGRETVSSMAKILEVSRSTMSRAVNQSGSGE